MRLELIHLISQLTNRKPIVGFGFLLLSAPAWAQISLVHVTACGPGAFPSTSCVIPRTGSGNLLVIGWASATGGQAAAMANITDNADNTYYEAGNARAVDASSNTMADLWYAKNSVAGATVLTITPNPQGTSGTAMIWEFSGADRSAPLDHTATLDSQPATTKPVGAAVTAASAGGTVVSISNGQQSVTGLVSGSSFTADSRANGAGWAHLAAASPGAYSPQWNSSSGTYCSTAASFRAASAAGSACDLNQDGVVNVVDVQIAVDMDLGVIPCPVTLNGGVCNSTVVQDILNAALTGICSLPVPPTHSVALNWTASVTPGVVGYNVYRATTSGGPFSKLNSSSLVASTNYTDNAVTAGQVYYYVTTAVDGSNDESAPSNEAQATVPSP
jgi:hypothetical protein